MSTRVAPRNQQNPASTAQKAFLRRLVSERQLTATQQAVVDKPGFYDEITMLGASHVIETLLAAPRKPVEVETPSGATVTATPVTEVGMYKSGDTFYKVQRSGTGNLYAKQLYRAGNGHWAFEYASGAIRSLAAEQRLTLAEAKAFGVEFGVCCVCAATLTDPKSVEAGIGPVCAKRI